MILALVNNKGGVAKTTTAVNLAAGLARKKKSVLLVDLDSQGSASLALGIPRSELMPSAADVLLHGEPIKTAIRNVAEGLDLLTGSMELANADLALADETGRERRLSDALKPIRSAYDIILLDCPPSLSMLPINALYAADGFIVPVEPQYLALEGLVNLTEAVERMREGMNIKASLVGLVLTKVDYRTKATTEIVDLIRGHYKRQVFKAEIRINTRLAEAPSFGQSIFDYDPTATGAAAYADLTEELLKRMAVRK